MSRKWFLDSVLKTWFSESCLNLCIFGKFCNVFDRLLQYWWFLLFRVFEKVVEFGLAASEVPLRLCFTLSRQVLHHKLSPLFSNPRLRFFPFSNVLSLCCSNLFMWSSFWAKVSSLHLLSRVLDCAQFFPGYCGSRYFTNSEHLRSIMDKLF